MSNVYSLADLRADLDKEFAPVEVDLGKGKVVLRNIMRLASKDRVLVDDALKRLNDQRESKEPDTAEVFEAIRDMLRVCADGNKGETLVTAIGDDLGLAMKILNLWMEATQVGEASTSPS